MVLNCRNIFKTYNNGSQVEMNLKRNFIMEQSPTDLGAQNTNSVCFLPSYFWYSELCFSHPTYGILCGNFS